MAIWPRTSAKPESKLVSASRTRTSPHVGTATRTIASTLLRARLPLDDPHLVEPACRLEGADQALRYHRARREPLQPRGGGGGPIGLEHPVDAPMHKLRSR